MRQTTTQMAMTLYVAQLFDFLPLFPFHASDFLRLLRLLLAVNIQVNNEPCCPTQYYSYMYGSVCVCARVCRRQQSRPDSEKYATKCARRPDTQNSYSSTFFICFICLYLLSVYFAQLVLYVLYISAYCCCCCFALLYLRFMNNKCEVALLCVAHNRNGSTNMRLRIVQLHFFHTALCSRVKLLVLVSVSRVTRKRMHSLIYVRTKRCQAGNRCWFLFIMAFTKSHFFTLRNYSVRIFIAYFQGLCPYFLYFLATKLVLKLPQGLLF